MDQTGGWLIFCLLIFLNRTYALGPNFEVDLKWHACRISKHRAIRKERRDDFLNSLTFLSTSLRLSE